MQKYLILIIFTLLPRAIIKAYVELSFFIYISKIKNKIHNEDDIDINMVNKLLSLTYNKTAIALPYYTYKWIWNDEFSNSNITIGGKVCKISDVLCNQAETVANRHILVERFIVNLPKIVKMKLFGNRHIVSKDTLSFKHALTKCITYS